jgi:two-component sensor histidine kinase
VTRLAVQIGPAVENAELFENAKRAEEEIRRLSEETAVIDAVAKIVTSTLDIQDVYEEFAQNLRQLVDLDTVVISVIDVEAGTLEHKYGYGEMRDRYKVGAILALEGTRTADVLATGQTLVLGDTPDDFRFSRDADNFKAGLRASINTPLVYRGQIFGMLYLRSKKKGAFGPREQAIVERLANQISPAVRNAQLYEDSRQLYADHMRLAEVNSSMVEIGRIIGSSLDISEVYEGVYQEMEKLVPFDRIVINLANVDRGTLNKSYMSGSGVAQKDVGHVFQIATSFSGQAIMHGVTQVCDPSNEADLDGHLSSLLPHFRAGLRSFLAVPLVSSGVAIGTMRLNSTTPNAYTKEVVGIVERIASVIAPALENSLMYNQQKKSLEEKEVLLKEINHRVKNNLQIISSLLNLQSRDIEDERVLQSIRAGQDRIGAMAMVHEKLYQSADLARIDFGEYIKSLAANLVSSYGLGSQNVDLKVDVEEILLGVDEAIPCGVIVNEMVSNSLKHAFPGDRPGTIVVSFREVGDDYTMVFKDDGVGLPEGLDVSCPSSLGWTIVNALIGQLRGSIELGSNGGCEVKISFPKR